MRKIWRGLRGETEGSGLGAVTPVRSLPGSFDVGTVALSADGRYGLCAGGDDPVRLWDLTTGTLLRELGTDGAGGAGLWTCGRRVVACGGGWFNAWNTSPLGWEGRLDTRPPAGRRGEPVLHTGASDRRGAITFSADGRFALGICDDNALRMWDLAGPAFVPTLRGPGVRIPPVRTLQGHGAYPTAVWLSADGQRAVSAGSDGEIRVWDVAGGTALSIPHPDGWVSSVCLSDDGRLVLAAGDHGGRTLWLLDATTGALVRAFEDARGRSPRHSEDLSADVLVARLTSDGQFAITGENDGRIRIWSTSTGRCVQTLEGHTDEVRAIALTPDDRFLLSGSSDGTVRQWQVGR
ncbi:WD40 repeat domain-containing protein [Kitasatospora sp. MBT66]|uniref:WD40 repeat domain-containing protein n=1 Tax=Kitasatospora sp. MBT66 TaxID=1444769 RepID=UPI0005BE51E6|nr:hypothetical protein [Kitasatospora sp. MBT66]